MSIVRVSLVAASALFLISAPMSLVSQQVDGRIYGVILDASGGAVAQASISAQHAGTGAVRRALSGSGGRYAIPALAPGSYVVHVSAEGFRPVAGEPVELDLGGEAEASFVLQVGSASETITVTATSTALQTSHVAVGSVIPNRFIVSLPLNGRNFLQLALLTPGTTPAAVGSPGRERGRFDLQTN